MEIYLFDKLTNIDNLQLQEDNKNIENRKHRVELFFNNEYKGVYSLDYIEEKIKK